MFVFIMTISEYVHSPLLIDVLNTAVHMSYVMCSLVCTAIIIYIYISNMHNVSCFSLH